MYKALTDQSIDALNKTTRTLNDTEHLTEKICTIMNEAATKSTTVKARYSAKPKLKVWTPKIKDLLENMTSNYKKEWVTYGKPTNPTNIIYSQRKLSRKGFRKAIRIEEAKQRESERDMILDTRTRDMRLFHKQVRNNRKKGHNLIDDLYVNGETYSGKENVLQGFTEHFRQLATNNQNNESEYHRKIEQEIQLINQLVKNKAIPTATIFELEKSIKSINTGKSADIYNITIEHINAGEQMITILLQIVNTIFDHGSVPDILKVGPLTPVFKNKGNIAEVINYRGITVLPVINKIIETIIKKLDKP